MIQKIGQISILKTIVYLRELWTFVVQPNMERLENRTIIRSNAQNHLKIIFNLV